MAVSDAPWHPSESDYSAQQWQRACLVDTGEGAPESKSRYKLPVREPSGELNRNGIHAAAGGHGIEAVRGISADVRAAAARKLVSLYNEIGDTPPDSLKNLAADEGGQRSAPETERLYISHFNGYNTGSPIEVRSNGKEGRSIGGYAAVFDRFSENLGGFREKVAPTFFNQARSNGFPNVVCRFNHDDIYLLGTTRSGTLKCSVDNVGLDYQVDLPECRSDVFEMTSRGDLRHSSFAFQCYEEDWVKGDGGYPVRMLMSGRLIDVAPVTVPAYPDATVGLRSLARHVGAPIEDVVAKAATDELRSFFERTDNRGKPQPPKPATSGRKALMDILGKRPEDPFAEV